MSSPGEVRSSRSARRHRRWASGWLLALIVSATGAIASSAAPTQRALLVGVSRYPALESNPAVPKLRGPASDVRLLSEVLSQRGFEAANLQILTNSSGPLTPTRSNILARLEGLTVAARAGDQVIVYISGHGSQQPAADLPGNEEPDGLDEVFLPADTTEWSTGQKRIGGAITDNEFGERLRRITATGASVWFIADACHSGTLTRGVPGIVRQVAPEALVPEAELAEARSKALKRSLNPPKATATSTPISAGALVEMYACQANESTIELPLSGRRGEYNGLFTFHLVQALARMNGPASYLDLMEKVRADYRAMHLHNPSPVLQGNRLRAPVPGSSEAAQPTHLHLRAASNQLRVTGGRLAGLKEGAVLRVLPWGAATATAPSQGLMHVEVSSVSLIEATVRPCAFAGDPAPEVARLRDGSRCLVVSNPPPDFRLRLAIVPGGAPAALWTDLETHPLLEGRLARASLLAEADWMLDHAVPGNASSLLRLHPAYPGGSSSNVELPPEIPCYRFAIPGGGVKPDLDALALCLRRIAHATGFLRAVDAPLNSRLEAAKLDFDMGVRIYSDESDMQGHELPIGDAGYVLGTHDAAVTFTNTSRVPIRVAAFYVDSNFGITAVPFTQTEPVNPGKPVASKRASMAPTVGWERIVALAVPADRYESTESIGLSTVEQDPVDTESPETTRGRRRRATAPIEVSAPNQSERAQVLSSPRSPLDQWLALSQTVTRGLGAARPLSEYRVKTLHFRVTADGPKPP